ncbi:hypothetical protein U91I_03274 [alpha proteobacterium U9-1i]|nr:hypothetical protein U91I_03274 [alpha proteobacterium U9-1i]
MGRPYHVHPGYDDSHQHAPRMALYVLMLVVAVAFGGFVWQLYSGPSAPLISAPSGAYRVEPAPELATAPDEAEINAFGGNIETPAPVATADSAPAEIAPPPVETSGAPRLAPAPVFAASGPFVAQLVALRAENGAQAAWARISSRAPGLFAPAHMDVERADLGAQGVFYRVRAGYFTDRANAVRFCERVRQMGQDCIVVQR